ELCHSIWHELSPADGLDVPRQWLEADARLLCQLQHRQLPLWQQRCADGRLVSQADQYPGRYTGPEDSDWWFARKSHREAGWHSAKYRRWRGVSGTGKRRY